MSGPAKVDVLFVIYGQRVTKFQTMGSVFSVPTATNYETYEVLKWPDDGINKAFLLVALRD